MVLAMLMFVNYAIKEKHWIINSTFCCFFAIQQKSALIFHEQHKITFSIFYNFEKNVYLNKVNVNLSLGFKFIYLFKKNS